MYFVLIHCHVYDRVLASLVIIYESERKNHACRTRARGGERTIETHDQVFECMPVDPYVCR